MHYYTASSRKLSAVVVFSYNPDESSSEDIAQHFRTIPGDVDSDFQLQSDLDGVDPWFWSQRDASILDDGNFLLFGNANAITHMATGQWTFGTVSFMPNAEQRTTSRAVEYQLDFTAMTATLVWEFQCDFAYSISTAAPPPVGMVAGFVLAARATAMTMPATGSQLSGPSTVPWPVPCSCR